jgi:hypothetical protein
MSGEAETAGDAAKGASGERQRSTIGFPYMDLASAIDLAEAIFKNVGGGECDDTQLAAWSEQSSKSSTFRVQVYAARLFGIISGEASRHTLTELGLSIVDQQRSRQAKVEAFLKVPLYSAIFNKFNGTQLPPAAALEREIVALGVAPKQKERARQVFDRSADQAGFFAHGKDRLVRPGIAPGAAAPPPVVEPERKAHGGGGGGGGDHVDPLINALIQKLPDTADEWPVADRVDWLRLMAMAFQIAYGRGAEISIKVSE